MNVKTIFNTPVLPDRGLRAVKTRKPKTFGPNFSVGIAPDTGTIKTRLDPGLVVEVQPEPDKFEWAELQWKAPAALLNGYGHFIFGVTAKATGGTTLSCAMRLQYLDRFEDIFAPRGLKLSPTLTVQEITFDLSPRQLARCGDIHLQIFFAPEEACVSFDRIDLTALY